MTENNGHRKPSYNLYDIRRLPKIVHFFKKNYTNIWKKSTEQIVLLGIICWEDQ